MRRGKSAGKFLRRAGPHGTHDSGAVLHRCVGVEGCGGCPQGIRRTAFAPTRPSLVVTYLRFGVPASQLLSVHFTHWAHVPLNCRSGIQNAAITTDAQRPRFRRDMTRAGPTGRWQGGRAIVAGS